MVFVYLFCIIAMTFLLRHFVYKQLDTSYQPLKYIVVVLTSLILIFTVYLFMHAIVKIMIRLLGGFYN